VEFAAPSGSFLLIEQHFDTEAFSLLFREAQLLIEKQKLAEAEQIYRPALQLGKISNPDQNAANLQLVFLYNKCKNWHTAKEPLISGLEVLNDGASSLSLSNFWFTNYTLRLCI
jgi:hypothetical protein